MSLSSRRNGPGPFGRGSWWEGFRCGSGPGLVRVFVPGGSRPTAPRARRRRHLHGYRGRCGQGCAMGAQAAGRGSGPPLGHGRRGRHCPPPVKTRLSTPSGTPTAARAGSVSGADGPWTKRTATGAEPRTRSHCAPSAPSNPPSAAGSVNGPGLDRGRGPRWSGRPGCRRSRAHAPGDFGSGRGSISPRARRRGRRLRAGRIRRRAHRRERRPATRAGRRTADQRRYAEPGADTSPHAAPRQSRRRRQSGEPQHRIFLPQGPDVSHITSRGRAAEDCRRDQFAQSSLRPASVPDAPRCLTLDGAHVVIENIIRC